MDRRDVRTRSTSPRGRVRVPSRNAQAARIAYRISHQPPQKNVPLMERTRSLSLSLSLSEGQTGHSGQGGEEISMSVVGVVGSR